MEKLKSLLSSVRRFVGKKVTMVVVGYLLVTIKSSHPDWPLPSEEFTFDLLLALIGAHTASDVVAIFKTAGNEVLAGKAK